MKGFILYSTYRNLNGVPHVLLFGKLENSQSFLTLNKYQPYFYIRESDLKSLPREYDSKKTPFQNFQKQKLAKIYLDSPAEVPKLRRKLEKKGVDCYEADIRFPQRFLIDTNIKTTLEIPDQNQDYETNELVDRIYHEPTLSPTPFYKPNLKVFSIDIETSQDGKDLYSLSIYSKKFQKSLLVSNKALKNTLTFKDEESLLENFKKIILEEDPDILTGWNVIDFDLDYLKSKFKQHKIPFTLGRTDAVCKLKLESDFFRTSKADFQGRLVLDAIDLIRGSFIQLENYKLSTAARHFLKQDKLIDDYNKGKEIERLYKNNPKKLIQYNLKDAKLVIDIINKTKVLDLAIHRSSLTGVHLDRVSGSISALDSLSLRKLREKKYAAPTSKFGVKENPITGGYVMESLPGIYENILILDFKSLYPSIIQTFNIDPLSFLGKKKEKNSVQAPNKATFSSKESILPEIIQDLMKEREKVKKKKDAVASFALKTIMASFIGVLGNPACRFFNPAIINAITQFGQYIIKLTAEKIKEKGYEVIYEDTDSAFVKTHAKTTKEAEKIGEFLVKKINSFFDKHIKQEYNRTNHLELEFEKVFRMFLMPHIRGSETGAKKRYAGLRIVNGKEKIEFTGLESRRRDWTDLAKKFQKELLNLIFHKKPVSNYIKTFVNNTKKGKYDSLLVYRKGIRKDLETYAVRAQHVKAALKLDKLDSNIIEYVITEDGPEPLQNQKHKIDYDHYIKKQIQPIADSILIFFDKTFDGILKGSEQSNLTSFNQTTTK